MEGAFDHHFMDSHSIHHPEKPLFLLSLQTSFWGEGRKFIGNDPDPPTLTICGGPGSIGEGFVRGEAFIAWTEGAIFFIGGFFNRWFCFFEVVRSFCTFCSNNDPLFCGWVLSQLGHDNLPSNAEFGMRIVE